MPTTGLASDADGVTVRTRRGVLRADRRSGRKNLWLRALDAAGLGFDS